MFKRLTKLFSNKGKSTESKETQEVTEKVIAKEKLNEISFQQGFDLTGFPVVTLYQGKKKFNFILDTGSTNCIINSPVLKNLEYKEEQGKMNWHGVEGNSVVTDTCAITLAYKNQEFPFVYIIGDMQEAFKKIKEQTGVTLHGILGSDFFNEFKYVLDFEELIAYSKL